MSSKIHNPNDPLENLAIGTIIEVDGSHIVAELKPGITELSRVFGGDTSDFKVTARPAAVALGALTMAGRNNQDVMAR